MSRAGRRLRKAFARPGLRLRLWLGAAALAALTIIAAAIAVYGLARTQFHAGAALAAQNRVEAYGSLAAQVNNWMLAWMMRPAVATDRTGETGLQNGQIASLDALPVQQALARLDQLIAEDVAAAQNDAESVQRARQSLALARLRAMFGQLEQVLATAPPGSRAAEAAIAFYMAQAPNVVASQIEQELHRRENALHEMAALQNRLRLAAFAIAATAAVVLLSFYLAVMRPLFARLTQMSLASEALVLDRQAPDAAGHDELGLMLARLRQLARRIERRRVRLEQDRARLEGIVAGRTADLSAANERLARIDSDRRRFFADVGHELRTPLTVIMGEAELGQRHGDPLVRAAFDTILARAKRLFSRIEDILRIARSDSGQLELRRERVALGPLLAAAQADSAPLLRRAGVSVRADATELAVAADPEWLRQVLAGILDNAAKYAGRGAEVRVGISRQSDRARLRIRDTGPGLPPALREQVFERFSRGGGGTEQGFGVGLALAAWVVEASGGRLTLWPDSEADVPEDGTAGETARKSAGGLGLQMDLPLWEEG